MRILSNVFLYLLSVGGCLSGPSILLSFSLMTICPLQYFHYRVRDTLRQRLQLGSRQDSEVAEQEDSKEKEDIRMEETGMEEKEDIRMEEKEDIRMEGETGREGPKCQFDVELVVIEDQEIVTYLRSDTVMSNL